MFAPVAGYSSLMRDSHNSGLNSLENMADEYIKQTEAKEELDKKNKPEALQNRTQEYTVIVKEPKLLGITLNRDGDRDGDKENYITIHHTKPNPYNIIQYSKLVKFSTGSIEVKLEGLIGENLKAAFRRLKPYIQAILPNDESTYVTLTFKSNKQHIPLYPYSVTLTSNIDMGIENNLTSNTDTKIENNKGKDINDNDVTIITIKDTNNNPYGITDGSRLVKIQYGSNFIENNKLIDITNYEADVMTLEEMIQEIKTLDETTHITLYFVSDNPDAPEKAKQQGEIAKQIAIEKAEARAQAETEAKARKTAERAKVAKLAMVPLNAVKAGVSKLFTPYKVEVKPRIVGGKSRKSKRHKSRRHKSRRHKSRRGQTNRRRGKTNRRRRKH